MHIAHSKGARWTPEAVEWQVEEYRLGCYKLGDTDDFTVYPSIDWQGRVCNLKIQHYDTNPLSPRFCHDDIGQSYWLGKMWLKEGKLTAGQDCQNEEVCFRNDSLFGEHLLPKYPAATVALVESPKNAIFGALGCPDMLWVATGNKHNLKRSTLLPLQGRNVIVIPDRDAIPLWKDTLKGMADIANFVVSDFCEKMAPEGQLNFDIADYLQSQHRHIGEVAVTASE